MAWTIYTWAHWLTFYVHNRRLGWSHGDLRVLRQIACKVR